MGIDEAISQANVVLPHVAVPDGQLDLRWQAIIGVGEFVESDPVLVWEFARRWAAEPDEDLRTALATCLLEHLLEHHFAEVFPRVSQAAKSDRGVAAVVAKCLALGAAAEPYNIEQFEALKAERIARAI